VYTDIITVSNSEIICGIDEAGRGPVIGPMVIACVCVDSNDIERLRSLGVRDSKLLTPDRRYLLYSKIREIAKYVEYVIVNPEEIDKYVEDRLLNKLEFDKIVKILENLVRKFKNVKVFIDSPTVNSEKFRRDLENIFRNLEIYVEHKADLNIVVVSAASIVAKCVRDLEIEKLKKVYGDFGSGYPSDPRTIKFLISYISRHGKLPPIARKSWKTCKKLISEFKRGKLM